MALRLRRRPERVAAYIRAGAALEDAGLRPVAVYGSGHDGPAPDPVKAGALAGAGVPYLGPGRSLRDEELVAVRPDLVVDVTYDGKSAYALDEATTERLGLPLLTLSVGAELSLGDILDRFGELAAALRDDDTGAPGAGELGAAEQAVRAAAAANPSVRVLALSAAGPDQVHLARPHAWPELAHLLALGVPLAEPGPGAGTNWLTAGWDLAAALRPGLVLLDSRANAVQADALTAYPAWRALTAHARVTPWNPETPPSPAAHAHFCHTVAAALQAVAG
ncbi:ABC transporter substrate-binding protein [Streptomyces purpureus]|nr:ABC transporter substrate-binding protein [Streptomyces purpureus]